MNNSIMLSILLTGTLCVPFYANAETISEQWGDWGDAYHEQDMFVSSQTVSSAESDTVNVENGDLMGIQLEGTPEVGLDVDRDLGLSDGVNDFPRRRLSS